MIQEEFVTFETSKLLKAAGYPQEFCATRYDRDGNKSLHHTAMYSAPTQTQAMQWLREERGQFISIYPLPQSQFDGIFLAEHQMLHNGYPWTLNYYRGGSYESAAEAGIQAACKYLIEKYNKD